jgi:hypothetical protein
VRRAGLFRAACLPLLFAVGCSPQAAVNRPPDATASAPANPNPTAPTVGLTTVKFHGLNDVLRAHRGEVVVMDVWAMW